MKLRALSKFVIVAVVGIIVLAATPTPRATAVRLDCPVLSVRVWCHPDCKSVGCDRYCSKLWDWDEYHIWVNAKADAVEGEGIKQKATNPSVEIQMLNTPHVGLTMPTIATPQTIVITAPDITINEVAIAWKDNNTPARTSFVLWRDTLGLDVTTVSGMSYPDGTVTTLWHGTCVKTSQQLPTVTPAPKVAPKVPQPPLGTPLKPRQQLAQWPAESAHSLQDKASIYPIVHRVFQARMTVISEVQARLIRQRTAPQRARE